MKNLTIILVALFFITIGTFAQIPNSGFETWENYTDDYTGQVYEKPDLWVGSLPKGNVRSFSITKNLESYPAGTGQYSMKIQADIDNGVRGIALSNDGPDPMKNFLPLPSFALNKRPTSLFLYCKYFPSQGDTMLVRVYLFKNGTLIGNGAYLTNDTISNWTPTEIPLSYYDPNIPDSSTIYFLTNLYSQHTESTLYVDNLSFDGFVTSTKEITSEAPVFKINPNPSSNRITLNINSKTRNYLTVNIYNSNGTLVKNEKLGQNQREIYVGDLCNGVYVVEINSTEITGRQKLVIQK